MIVLLPNRRVDIGETVRRFNALGFSLSNVRGRLVATPINSTVVAIRTTRVTSAFTPITPRCQR